MKFFSYESKFSQTLLKIANCCLLNLLWFVCSLPIFTMGAATTALYYVTLKMVRDEEGAVVSQFFRAFRENFRQATVLWLILLAAGALLAGDSYILFHLFRTTTGPVAVLWTLLFALVIAASIAYAIVLAYVFPLVASVENTNRAMLINALFMGIRYLFCTILIFAIHFAMFFVVVRLFTPAIVLGQGLCALLSSYLLSGVIRACSYVPDREGMEQGEEP